MDSNTAWLSALFAFIALLYASVGQAGASGYLATMGLFGMAPTTMKVTALSLNLVVAAIGTAHFWRSGLLSWRIFYPFAILGFPFSLMGGAVQLPTHVYYPAVGSILLLSAVQMMRAARRSATTEPPATADPPFLPSLATGALIGFVSGSTGTGGGIFLAPIILSMNWMSLRRTAAVTAVYNLLNSAAALIGAYRLLSSVPSALPVWIAAAAAGGVFGAFIGNRILPENVLRHLLALLLAISGFKLIAS